MLAPSLLLNRIITREVTIDLIAHVTRPQIRNCHWTIKCHVRNPLVLDSNTVTFDEQSNLLSPSHTFKVMSVNYESPIPLRCLEAKVHEHDIAVQVRPISNFAGRIEIQPSGDIPAGVFNRQIELIAHPETNELLPPVLVNVIGLSVQDIHIIPCDISFGPLELGKQQTAELRLESRTKGRFSVISVDVAINRCGYQQSIVWTHRVLKSDRASLRPGYKLIMSFFM